ncbi:MAG TPA: hypothetical protein VF314_03830 [Actinomycetes bacterium]
MTTIQTPVPAPAPAPPAPARRPSTRWYWAAGLVALVGLVAAAALVAAALISLNDHIDGYARTPIPGQVSVTVDEPGTQVIYYEGPSGATPELYLSVYDPSGAPVTVRQSDASLQYDVSGRAGQSVAEFEATMTGTYLVDVSDGGAGGMVAVGDNFADRVIVPIIGAVALVMTAGGAALAMVIVTAVRRSQPRLDRPTV